MKHVVRLILLIASLQVAGIASAQTGLSASLGLVVYPSAGQAADQLAKDEGECYSWSRQSTGVDPADPLAGVQTQAPQQAPPAGGGAGGGAARGAARGAVIGNLADEDASDWAAAGAVVGGVRGAKRSQQQQAQAQAQAQAQTQAQAAERIDLFKKAYAACMEGRSYTVK